MLGLQKNQSGFTLLEVLISLVILSVGLLGLASLTGSIIRTNSFSNYFTTATVLTQDQLEQLVNTSFASLTAGTTSDPNNPIDEDGNAGGIFTRQWTIVFPTATTANVTATVSWTSALGKPHSISISTTVRQ